MLLKTQLRENFTDQQLSAFRKEVLQIKTAYHFIGIGGCGMSGLAQVLHHRGHGVSGSDQCRSAMVDTIKRLPASCDDNRA